MIKQRGGQRRRRWHQRGVNDRMSNRWWMAGHSLPRRTLCTKSGIPDLPGGKVVEKEVTSVKKAIPEDAAGGNVE